MIYLSFLYLFWGDYDERKIGISSSVALAYDSFEQVKSRRRSRLHRLSLPAWVDSLVSSPAFPKVIFLWTPRSQSLLGWVVSFLTVCRRTLIRRHSGGIVRGIKFLGKFLIRLFLVVMDLSWRVGLLLRISIKLWLPIALILLIISMFSIQPALPIFSIEAKSLKFPLYIPNDNLIFISLFSQAIDLDLQLFQ